jgi:hypothetical protein
MSARRALTVIAAMAAIFASAIYAASSSSQSPQKSLAGPVCEWCSPSE